MEFWMMKRGLWSVLGEFCTLIRPGRAWARRGAVQPFRGPVTLVVSGLFCAALAACGGGGGETATTETSTARALSADTSCNDLEVARLLAISIHIESEERERNIALLTRCNKEMLDRDIQALALAAESVDNRARPLALAQPKEETLNFESPHVHPLSLTPDGNTLLAVNTAGHSLEVFTVSGTALTLKSSIRVGLDPVTVRALSNTRAWVINHAADTVSVVDLERGTVVQTLETDNEPTDVVFAGSPARAFVTASKANKVNVFDAANPTAAGRQTIDIQGLNPRALAVSSDGSTVYAAIFESGNGTRISGGRIVVDGVLADNDVAMINASTLAVTYRRKLMTMVMGIAVNPANGRISVVGTESLNNVVGEPELNGIFVRSHLASFTPNGAATVRDLNPHLTYTVRSVAPSLRAQSVADPRGIAWRSSGTQAFVTGMGSNNVAVIDADGARLGHFDVGAGPTGVVLKDSANLGFVLNRFDGSISTIDLNGRRAVATTAFFDPTPEAVKRGRRFLFDARMTSGLGQASCASCHVDGRTDRLAWDLSDPNAANVSVPMASNNSVGALTGTSVSLGGNKGPMVTQTLIDIMDFPRFHWRGDRNSIDEFNGAFTKLMAADRGLNGSEMADLKAYLSTLWMQPNPYRRIDDSRPNSVVLPDGRTVTSANMNSLRGNNPTSNNCLGCHSGQGNATRNFGANPEVGSHIIAPSLPGLYNRLGQEQGLSGFGFFHDGAANVNVAARISTFESNPAFLAEIMTLEGPSGPLVGAELRNAPHAGIGKGLTVNGSPTAAQSALLTQIQDIAQSSPHAALVAHALVNGIERGFVYQGSNAYRIDARAQAQWTQAQLLALAANGQPVTFMLVAQGTETRIALDRDLNGVWNFDQANGNADTVTVRGGATLAGGVGARMELRINGSLVANRMVTSIASTDMVFQTPTIKPGDRIDLVFTNDDTVNGEDRNLFVESITAAGVTLPSTAPQVIIDQGDGALAFDGLEITPAASIGGWIPWNAAMRFTVPSGGTGDTVTVQARATLAGGVGAQMELRLNGVLVGSRLVNNTVLQDLVFNTPPVQPGDRIDVVFTNDAEVAGQDRNLHIQAITTRQLALPANNPGVTIDRGSGALAFDGLETVTAASTDGWLPWNAAMRFVVPVDSAGSTITLRGRSTLAAGLGAAVELRLNGVLVGSRMLGNTTVQDIVFNAPTVLTGDRIDVVFTNDAFINDEDRNLFVESVTANGVTLSSMAAGVTIDVGEGATAFDGLDVIPASTYGGWVPWTAAMRFVAR
jgi:Ca-dependent carbohydrate-binding module xylan-binding/Lactonase, 7-bladed beta-propeller